MTTKKSGIKSKASKATEVDMLSILKSALDQTGRLSSCYQVFHDYSIGNQLLLMGQFAMMGMEPCPVATYKKWQDLGRQVQKGAKGMAMYIPSIGSREETDDDGNVSVISWRKFFLKNLWFPVSMTAGKSVEMKLETPVFSLSRILENLGIKRVPYTMMDGNCQGYCEKESGNIAINPIARHPDKTALHEIAHSLLHCGEALKAGEEIHDDRGVRECEAESTALISGSILGILSDTEREESVGYIKNWMSSVARFGVEKLLKESAQRIFSAVDRILKANDIVTTVSKWSDTVLDENHLDAAYWCLDEDENAALLA